MSKPKYDVSRVSDATLTAYVQQALNYGVPDPQPELDNLRAEARVPEPTAAELENRLVEMVLHADVSSEKWLRAKLRELQEAHTREAKESDSE